MESLNIMDSKKNPKKINKYQFKSQKKEQSHENSFAPNVLFRKILKQGEIFLHKLPLMKILPIMKKSKNTNFIWIVFFVLKFVRKLKQQTFEAKYDKLNYHNFALINDNAQLPRTKLFIRKTIIEKNFLKRQVF